MPWNQQQYETASAFLKEAQAHPDADPKKVAALEAKIRDHEASIPLSTSDPNVTIPEVKIEGNVPGTAADPAVRVLGADEVQPEDAEGERQRVKAELYDPNLPTASKSKNPDLIRDPEFHPPPQPGFHPLTLAMGALPTYLGGAVINWHEPSEAHWHRETGGAGNYDEYRDAKYAQAFDEAKAAGTPIIRREFLQHPTWIQRAQKVADDTNQKAQAAVYGLQEGGAMGLPAALVAWGARKLGTEDPMAGMQNAAENNPTTAGAGELAGILMPGGLAERAAAGAGKVVGGARNLVKGIAGESSELGWAGRTAAAAGKGAVGAGVQSAGQSFAHGINGEEVDPMAATKAAIESSLFGAGIGGAASQVSELAKAGRSKIRKDIPALATAERAGVGETSTLGGVKPTRLGQTQLDIAEHSPDITGAPLRTNPQTLVADSLQRPFAQDAADQAALGEFEHKAIREKYFNVVHADRRSTGPILKAVGDLHKAIVDEAGNPVLARGPDVQRLRGYVNALTNVEQYGSRGEANEAMRAAQVGGHPEADAIDWYEAREKGLKVPDDEAAKQAWYLITPKKYNAGELQAAIEGIDNLVVNKEAPKPELEAMQRAIRDVRDTYPATGPLANQKATIQVTNPYTGSPESKELSGWSAFEHNASERIKGNAYRNRMAGLPESPKSGDLSADEEKAFQGATKRYGEPGRMRENESQRVFAKRAGSQAEAGLENIAGHNALQDLKKVAPFHGVVGLHGIREYAPTAALKLRMDPSLGQLAAPGFAPAAGRGAAEQEQKYRVPLLDMLGIP